MATRRNRALLPGLLALALACAAVPAFAETYRVYWDPVTRYTDGTALEAGKTVTYTVYWTTDPAFSPASLKTVAASTSATSAPFDPVAAGMARGTTVYFTAKAMTDSGEESSLASGVSWLVPRKPPRSPGNTRIIKLN